MWTDKTLRRRTTVIGFVCLLWLTAGNVRLTLKLFSLYRDSKLHLAYLYTSRAIYFILNPINALRIIYILYLMLGKNISVPSTELGHRMITILVLFDINGSLLLKVLIYNVLFSNNNRISKWLRIYLELKQMYHSEIVTLSECSCNQ